jgi:hypothetical protein
VLNIAPLDDAIEHGPTEVAIAGIITAGRTRAREAERISEADIAHLTDARVSIVKAALQLTPDQEKSWPAVEDAIRARGKDRQTRLAAIQKEVGELRGKSPLEVLRDRSPVDFLSQRATTRSK